MERIKFGLKKKCAGLINLTSVLLELLLFIFEAAQNTHKLLLRVYGIEFCFVVALPASTFSWLDLWPHSI